MYIAAHFRVNPFIMLCVVVTGLQDAKTPFFVTAIHFPSHRTEESSKQAVKCTAPRAFGRVHALSRTPLHPLLYYHFPAPPLPFTVLCSLCGLQPKDTPTQFPLSLHQPVHVVCARASVPARERNGKLNFNFPSLASLAPRHSFSIFYQRLSALVEVMAPRAI